MIVGTAGHVDHGKTALVRALTGVEGDRLKEEKARGITIELGFAYLPIDARRVIGFVDVPGHEHFVRTMVAGASGVDFALLVVACDDGVKPQTREHLAILDLMGVDRGIVALTKADLVSDERQAAVADEMRRLLAATRLAEAEMLAVSARTGDGIAALRARLIEADEVAARPSEGRFRMAVDRAFTLTGVGLVVTGPALSGRVRIGDAFIVSPSGREARVRSLHAQNRAAEFAEAGERCALALVGRDVSKDNVSRGDMLLDPTLHAPTHRIDATLRVLPGEPKPIATWFPARLHHAATEVGARIVPLDAAAIAPGGAGHVQLVLERPIAAAQGDRYLLRDVSAQRTIGGGQFLDLRAPARKRRTPERAVQRAALALSDPARAFAALLEAPPFVADLAVFARDRALSEAQTRRIGESDDLVLINHGGATFAVTADRWRQFAGELRERLAVFHVEYPDLQGCGYERLRTAVEPRWPRDVFRAALARLAGQGRLTLEGGFARLPEHVAHLSDADLGVWRQIASRLGAEARFRPPRVRDLAAEIGEDERALRRVCKLASRLGWVDEIAHDHFFLRETTREMIGLLVGVASQHAEFSAAQFRDRLDNGRKVAIQILEFFDRHGVTTRRGDLRRLNPRRLDLFSADVLSSSGEQGGESFLVGRSDFKSEGGSQPVSGGFDSHSPPPDASR